MTSGISFDKSRGTTDYSSDAEQPMPLYKDYLEYLSGFDAKAVRLTTGGPGWTPKDQQVFTDDIDQAKACLAHPRLAPASIQGEMVGFWDRNWR